MARDARTGAPVPALSGEDLVAAVPGLADLATVRVDEFANLPSAYMGPDQWLALSSHLHGILADEIVVGAIVLHGTDTLDQTAWFLDLTLTGEKPVVLVGAQRNASEPDSDGPRNLRDAVRQVLAEDVVGMGVTVTMNGRIHAARDVRKGHTGNVESFHSGEFGPLGTVDEDRVVFARRPLRRRTLPLPARVTRVDLVPMVAGADGDQVRHAVTSGAEAIVVAAYGLGNVNAAMHAAIAGAITANVPVIVASQVPQGRTLPVYGFPGGGRTLLETGAVFADDLSPDKARIFAMLALPVTRDRAHLQMLFDP